MDKTVRLFDIFPSESEFEATVLSCAPDEKGNYTVVLDKTLFFPRRAVRLVIRVFLAARRSFTFLRRIGLFITRWTIRLPQAVL